MTSVEQVRAAVASVADPELPVVTIDDLGILRSVEVDGDAVTVTITPTYSGCPALDEIRHDIETALAARGIAAVTVRTALAPAWSTDDIRPEGRRKLLACGIAPPSPRPAGPVLVPLGAPAVRCPQCGSSDTEEMSRFGSTACQALWRCRACREPFGHVKPH